MFLTHKKGPLSRLLWNILALYYQSAWRLVDFVERNGDSTLIRWISVPPAAVRITLNLRLRREPNLPLADKSHLKAPIMKDFIRDSPLGLAIRFATKNKYLRHAEKLENFTHPYYLTPVATASEEPTTRASTASLSDVERGTEDNTEDNIITRLVTQQTQHELEKNESIAIKPTVTSSGHILVDWYTTGSYAATEVSPRY